MKRLELSFNDVVATLDYKLNEFTTGDIYHVIVRTPDIASAVGKDHFFKVCREGPDIHFEFSIVSPDQPKNRFRVLVAETLLELTSKNNQPDKVTVA